MKKLLLNAVVWIPIITITFLVFQSINETQEEDWKTYQKNEKEVKKRPTTQIEKKEARLAKRTPSQHEREFPKYKGRRLINPQNKEIFWDEVSFINEINPNWKDLLAENLLSMQKGETKVFIKEELKLIKVRKGEARYLERVIITYLKENGMRSSFSAYVDSETGAVVETWNQTRFEPIRRKRIE